MTSRLGAALGYKRGLTWGDMAAALNVHERTVKRMAAEDRPLDSRQRDAIAELTGVPAWFLEHGFTPPADVADQTALDRIAALERQVQTLMRRAADATPPDLVPPGDTPHPQADGEPSSTSAPGSEPKPAEGSP